MAPFHKERLSVAVVGSGIAGAFAAHFLREALGDQVEVTVFEREDRVGGRVRQIEVGGLPVEAGAAAIHSSNLYLGRAIDALHLQRSSSAKQEQPGRRSFGIWNGASFDFVAPWSGEEGAGFLMRRYGQGLLKVVSLVKDALEGLLRIYDRQEQGEAFDTPESLHRSLGLYDLTQQDAYSFFRQHEVDDPFVFEMSDGIARGNYGQAGHMNAWVTLVSLIGGGLGGGHLYSVVGGNVQICQGLLAGSGARVFTSTAVNRVAPGSPANGRPGPYTVKTLDGREFTFDAVIVATPLELAGITFQDIALPQEAQITRAYQTTHVTFVAGQTNPAFFGLGPGETAPDLVLTRERHEIPFSTIGVMGRAADGERVVYKMFSRQELDEGLLDAMFAHRTETVRLAWKAYPVLNPMPVWPPFRLSTGLYYVNAMESAVSTMETEAIAARNVANLLVREMHR